MWAALYPRARVSSVTALTPAYLRARGLAGLIVDLDNTLAPWNVAQAPAAVRAWLDEVQGAGVRVVVLSNNGERRVRAFADAVGVLALAGAGKPRGKAFRRALAVLGTPPAATAVVGDRLFMDVLGGNRAGLFTVLVPPLAPRELWATRLVRHVEDWLVDRMPPVGA